MKRRIGLYPIVRRRLLFPMKNRKGFGERIVEDCFIKR
jgi:hypothetical protein